MIALEISLNNEKIVTAGIKEDNTLTTILKSSVKSEEYKLSLLVQGIVSDLSKGLTYNWEMPKISIGDTISLKIVDIPIEEIDEGNKLEISKDTLNSIIDKTKDSLNP